MDYYGIRERFNDEHDIREILKENIMGRKKYVDDDTAEMEKKYKKEDVIVAHQYILLDSFLKNKNSSTEIGQYNWNLNPQSPTVPESIGIYEVMDYVIEIQIGSFSLPILDDVTYIDPTIQQYGQVYLIQNNTNMELNLAPTMVRKSTTIGQYPSPLFTNETETYIMPWINNPYSQTPYYSHISIQIVETGLQSFASANGTRFNFEYDLAYSSRLGANPNFVEAKPVNANGWDSFTFLNPIRNLNTISLVIRNPDSPINFEPDVMYYSVINLTVDPIGGGAHVTIFTQFPHKLNGGDRVFLQNFVPKMPDGITINTNFPNYLTTYINRPAGHTVNSVFGVSNPVNTGDPIPDSGFCLDPSIEIINPTDPNISPSFPGLVDVCIAKRRLRIPMKIKYLKNKDNKNYVFQ